MELKINHPAVILAAILQMVNGMLWYGAFSEPWLAAIGKTKDQLNPSDPVPYIISFIAALATAYVMAWVFREQRVRFVGDGIKVSLILFFGFFFFIMCTHYSFAGASWDLFWIDGGHTAINFLLTGIVLTVWKKKPKKA